MKRILVSLLLLAVAPQHAPLAQTGITGVDIAGEWITPVCSGTKTPSIAGQGPNSATTSDCPSTKRACERRKVIRDRAERAGASVHAPPGGVSNLGAQYPHHQQGVRPCPAGRDRPAAGRNLRPRPNRLDGRKTASFRGRAAQVPGLLHGRWEGDTLVVETTHMKLGFVRRNGTPTSERARKTEYFTRYGDHLLVTTVLDDPVYLSEPFIRTTEYVLTLRALPIIGFPSRGTTHRSSTSVSRPRRPSRRNITSRTTCPARTRFSRSSRRLTTCSMGPRRRHCLDVSGIRRTSESASRR